MDYFTALIFLAIFGIVICTSEIAARFLKFNSFVTRKVAHIFCGITTSFIPIFTNFNTAILIGICLTLIVLFTRLIGIFNNLESSDKSRGGTIFFPIGFIISCYLFWNISIVIVSFAAMVLGFSDALAAIFGKKFGKIKYKVFDEKSYLGSIVFALVTFAITIIFLVFSGSFYYYKIPIAFAGSFVVAVVEGLSAKGVDNIFIQIAAGLLFIVLI